ncbi:hypothetical protein MSAN_00726800 [Mycena sanguinolenta]|uniref:Uncharacterized protein n=1 Tax=Mycena sanguinolenta TaxID=230812 RepID=A0A8H7DD02_9AGAR|nr:hypothetical protein MSAN_00726800 [Mycena sanguinolenta]
MLPSYEPVPSPSHGVRTRGRGKEHARPRGLWKGGKTKPGLDLDELHPTKRPNSEETSDDEFEGYFLLEYSPEPFGSECNMDEPTPEPPDSHFEDWEDLKELFARATEQYESDDVNKTVCLFRSVIRESAQFLLRYEDPSLLFAEPRARSKTPELSPISSLAPKKKCTCRESPTAFHALLGTALFLFGNLIAQDPSLALPNEPSLPATYWLAALDVFEMGENLPSRTSGRGCDAPEDWRKAIIWGRTLLCVADASLTLQQQGPNSPPPAPEPKWPSPAASPFAAIASRRLPASRRIVLATASPHDLLLLAMDHFASGIFHMPRTTPTPGPGIAPAPAFNRSAELLTIAQEVLALAERLPAASERVHWATWADNVLQQIKVQTDVIARARGRCWLIIGTARVEDIEAMAEARGWGEDGQNSSPLDTEDAEDAREGLERAVEFFERARGEEVDDIDIADAERRAEAEELRTFLAEALLTLANLTKEEQKREALYQRAQLLGGDALEGMEVDESAY